jgi:translation elongation factor EF-1beta
LQTLLFFHPDSPEQGNYRELVSCSNCTDFQSRAMGIRCGAKKMGQVSASYVHMLNSTLCATGRGICCLLENYQTAEGVVVPEVLRLFMGGTSFLPFVREARVEKDEKPPAKASSSKPAAAPKAAAAAAAPAPKEAKVPAAAKAPAPAPAVAAAAPAADPSLSPAANAHVASIVAIGNKVCDMKANKAPKEDITAALVELKNAKDAYKGENGKDYVAPGTQGNSKDKKKEKNAAAAAAAPAAAAPASKKAPPAAKPTAAPAATAKANKPPPAPKAAPAPAAESGPLGALGAGALDSALLFQSYVCGYSATAEDASAYAAYSAAGVDAAAAKAAGKTNVARWLSHMASFTPAARAAWPAAAAGGGAGGAAPVSCAPPPVAGVLPAPATSTPVAAAAKSAPAPKAAAAAAEDDDEMDWGDDDDDEDAGPKEAVVHPPGSRAAIAAEAKAKRDAETEKKKEEAMARLAKKEANQRSLCNLEIKPWEASQDLKALYAKIKETVVLDGLKWSENCALVDVAFGVQKIVCTAVIPLSLSMDAIIDDMTEDSFADEIQSMNMTSMSLL